MIASSNSARDRDTTAVARCVRAAGSHIVRFRYANSTSTTVTATFADNSRPYPVAYSSTRRAERHDRPDHAAHQQRGHTRQRQLREPRQHPGPLAAMLDGEDERAPARRTIAPPPGVCTATASPPSALSERWPVSGRAATPAAARPATATFVDAVRGAAMTASTHQPRGRRAEQRLTARGVVCRAKSTAVCTPSRETGTAAACAACHDQPAAARRPARWRRRSVNGPVARRISSPR